MLKSKQLFIAIFMALFCCVAIDSLAFAASDEIEVQYNGKLYIYNKTSQLYFVPSEAKKSLANHIKDPKLRDALTAKVRKNYPDVKTPLTSQEIQEMVAKSNLEGRGKSQEKGQQYDRTQKEGVPIAENKSGGVNNAGTNTKAPEAHVTGCSSDYGLFSGLIKTGSDIFKGLRDLIYVVAGFGIIGVAVGGFFGNLNWKWLGAILIALVVIASTGEIINMITGCDNFSDKMITDTLK